MLGRCNIPAVIIGLGGIAWKYDASRPSPFPLTQAAAMRAHGGIALLAGCSPEKLDREGFTAWSGLPAFVSHEEMLTEVRPQLVGICSPTECHFEHFVKSVLSGARMIWLEKPPAANMRQCLEMERLAQKYGVTVCVNYFRRYLPLYQQFKTRLQSEMGPLFSLHIQYSPGLMRNGCHLLDLLFFLTDADSYHLLWKDAEQAADSPSFALRLSTGQLALISGGPLEYHSNSISAVCANGILSVLHGGADTLLEQRCPNPSFPGFFTLQNQSPDFDMQEPLDRYMERSLQDLIKSNQSGQAPLSNLKTARLSLRLMNEVLGNA